MIIKKKDSKYWYRKFIYAFRGIFLSLQEEKSMIIHTIISILVIVFALGIKIENLLSWAIIAIMIGLVIATELLNTAIENLVDMVSFKYNINARKIKDISAAATLVVAIIAVVVALLIFVPRLVEIVQHGY